MFDLCCMDQHPFLQELLLHAIKTILIWGLPQMAVICENQTLLRRHEWGLARGFFSCLVFLSSWTGLEVEDSVDSYEDLGQAWQT